MEADLFDVFDVWRDVSGDSLGDVGALDGNPVTALTLCALRPFMFSLLSSDDFPEASSTGYRSMDG